MRFCYNDFALPAMRLSVTSTDFCKRDTTCQSHLKLVHWTLVIAIIFQVGLLIHKKVSVYRYFARKSTGKKKKKKKVKSIEIDR